MIFEWTYFEYYQHQRYFGTGFLTNYSSRYALFLPSEILIGGSSIKKTLVKMSGIKEELSEGSELKSVLNRMSLLGR